MDMKTVDKTWLKDFVGQLADDLGHEGGLGVGEEGDGCHQRPAVEEDHVLTIISIRCKSFEHKEHLCEIFWLFANNNKQPISD